MKLGNFAVQLAEELKTCVWPGRAMQHDRHVSFSDAHDKKAQTP